MRLKWNERMKGITALIFLALVFASMGIFARYLNAQFSILQQTYLRIMAAFFLGYIIFYKDIHLKKIRKISLKEWGILLFRSICLYVIGVPLISEAFISSKYSNASFLSSLPMTAILGFILLKEKITLQKIMYVFIGLIGVMLIAIKDYSHFLSWGNGDLYALISSIFFALSYISRKWQSNFLNNKEIAVLMFLISSILLFALSLLGNEGIPSNSHFTYFMICIIIISGLFNVANLFLTNYGFQKIQAVQASNILTLEVLFAVIISIFYYREFPSFNEYIGGAFIVFSAYKINILSE